MRNSPIPILAAAAFLTGGAAVPPHGEIEVRIEHLRNLRGMVQICFTTRPDAFPDCSRDRQAITRTVAADAAGIIRFEGIRPGTYAMSVFHDENGNKKLDTFLGIPREGFGFSRNPKVRFGPPHFSQAGFEVGQGIARVIVRMQYLL